MFFTGEYSKNFQVETPGGTAQPVVRLRHVAATLELYTIFIQYQLNGLPV